MPVVFTIWCTNNACQVRSPFKNKNSFLNHFSNHRVLLSGKLSYQFQKRSFTLIMYPVFVITVCIHRNFVIKFTICIVSFILSITSSVQFYFTFSITKAIITNVYCNNTGARYDTADSARRECSRILYREAHTSGSEAYSTMLQWKRWWLSSPGTWHHQ